MMSIYAVDGVFFFDEKPTIILEWRGQTRAREKQNDRGQNGETFSATIVCIYFNNNNNK